MCYNVVMFKSASMGALLRTQTICFKRIAHLWDEGRHEEAVLRLRVMENLLTRALATTRTMQSRMEQDAKVAADEALVEGFREVLADLPTVGEEGEAA
jgi:hypothetical protein